MENRIKIHSVRTDARICIFEVLNPSHPPLQERPIWKVRLRTSVVFRLIQLSLLACKNRPASSTRLPMESVPSLAKAVLHKTTLVYRDVLMKLSFNRNVMTLR